MLALSFLTCLHSAQSTTVHRSIYKYLLKEVISYVALVFLMIALYASVCAFLCVRNNETLLSCIHGSVESGVFGAYKYWDEKVRTSLLFCFWLFFLGKLAV